MNDEMDVDVDESMDKNEDRDKRLYIGIVGHTWTLAPPAAYYQTCRWIGLYKRLLQRIPGHIRQTLQKSGHVHDPAKQSSGHVAVLQLSPGLCCAYLDHVSQKLNIPGSDEYASVLPRDIVLVSQCALPAVRKEPLLGSESGSVAAFEFADTRKLWEQFELFRVQTGIDGLGLVHSMVDAGRARVVVVPDLQENITVFSKCAALFSATWERESLDAPLDSFANRVWNQNAHLKEARVHVSLCSRAFTGV